MQAIQTRYYGPTNTRPARIRAWATAGNISVSVHVIPANENRFRHAALALCLRLNWSILPEILLEGSLPNGDTVFVFDLPASRP